jgi:hypothetical protein
VPAVAFRRVHELLSPPPHRGPLIAAGAVVLATGIVLAELRLDAELAPGVALVVVGAAAALILVLGLHAPNEDGGPPAYRSVLLVTGLLLLGDALLRLADVLGAEVDGVVPPAGTLTWTSLVLSAVAAYAAARSRSAACLLIAAIATGIAMLAALDWIVDPDGFGGARWLLLVLAAALVLAALRLRADAPRHAELLIDGAGFAILVIGLQAVLRGVLRTFFDGLPDDLLSVFWELVILAVACGLIAYGAVDRSPGPAWLGIANLTVFVAVAAEAADATLYWWPLLLIVIGGGALAAGLRPRSPLPPEPDGYRAGEQPLAARASDDDELVLRVRDDSPPAGSFQDR